MTIREAEIKRLTTLLEQAQADLELKMGELMAARNKCNQLADELGKLLEPDPGYQFPPKPN